MQLANGTKRYVVRAEQEDGHKRNQDKETAQGSLNPLDRRPPFRDTTCVRILQHLTSVSVGINEHGRRESTTSERAMRHVRQSRLTFRHVFTAVAAFLSFVAALIGVRWRRQALALRLAAAHRQPLTEAPPRPQRGTLTARG